MTPDLLVLAFPLLAFAAVALVLYLRTLRERRARKRRIIAAVEADAETPDRAHFGDWEAIRDAVDGAYGELSEPREFSVADEMRAWERKAV